MSMALTKQEIRGLILIDLLCQDFLKIDSSIIIELFKELSKDCVLELFSLELKIVMVRISLGSFSG